MNRRSIVVIGAGIVGATTALELQQRGHEVVLIDKELPGTETSFGNAGVLSDASVIIVNNPELPFCLPKMLLNTNITLRYNLLFVLSFLPWISRFLYFCNRDHMLHAGKALRELLVESLPLHEELIKIAGAEAIYNKTGFLKLYRTKRAFSASLGDLEFYKEVGVGFETYSGEEVRKLEPSLKQGYYRGVFLKDACSVTSPSDLTKAYVGLFEKVGGTSIQSKVRGISTKNGQGFEIQLTNLDDIRASDVVIAAGPWSAEVAKWLGYNIPMAWERGYHTHLQPSKTNPLSRPIHDVEAGFVAAPHKEGTRILTGVELTFRDASPNYKQIEKAVSRAKEVLELGAEDSVPWLGRRPTIADSLPMIGPATRHKGVWFNFGHQHVGLSTSTGCATILADLMENKPPNIDHTPFSPNRFRI